MGVLLELTDILVLLMEQLQKFSDNENVVTAASGLIEVLTAAGIYLLKLLFLSRCLESCLHYGKFVFITGNSHTSK